MSIDLCEGKYHWHDDGISLQCRRNGIEWRDFTGDNALKALYDHATDLQAENKKLKEQLQHAENVIESLRNDIDNLTNSVEI